MKTLSVTVAAAYSKRRREDRQILHPDIVRRFRRWLKKRKPKPGEILFPISERTCGVDRRTSKMMAQDLTVARNAWIQESPDAKTRRQRKASDFLKHKDSQGRFADFHSLRHMFVTNFYKSDVAPKTTQTLARHSDIRLTMDIYSHVDEQEQADAMGKLRGWVGGRGGGLDSGPGEPDRPVHWLAIAAAWYASTSPV